MVASFLHHTLLSLLTLRHLTLSLFPRAVCCAPPPPSAAKPVRSTQWRGALVIFSRESHLR